jgi:hypothetical protein
MKQRILSGTAGNLKAAVIGSSVLVLPFIILELVNRRDYPNGFPILLFGFMWLMALVFIVILMPIQRSQHATNQSVPSSVSLLPRIVLLILIAWMWVSLVIDQMPCFLGVPNCD